MTEPNEFDLPDTETAPPLGDPDRERWKITGDRSAAWAMRQLAARNAEIDRIEGLARDEYDRIDAWAADASHGARADAEFFAAHLKAYYADLYDADPKLPKTYPIPGGKLQRRKNPDRVEVTDEDAFVGWALDSHQFDLLNVKPLKSVISDAAKSKHVVVTQDGAIVVDTSTGETMPGVRVVTGDERIEAKPDKGL